MGANDEQPGPAELTDGMVEVKTVTMALKDDKPPATMEQMDAPTELVPLLVEPRLRMMEEVLMDP